MSPAAAEIDLAPAAQVFWDASGALGPDEVRGAPFGPHRGRAQPFFPRGALWLRVELENPSEESLTRFLAFDDPLLERLDVWLDVPGGRLHRVGGYGVPRGDRTIEMHGPWHEIPLVVLAGERVGILARLQSPGPIFAGARVGEGATLVREFLAQIVRQGIHVGVLLALAVLNLYSFLALRERGHLAFLGLTLAYAGFEISETGLLAGSLPKAAPGLIASLPPLFAGLSMCFALIFADAFMLTRMGRASRVVGGAAILAAAVAIVDPRHGNLAAAAVGAAAFPLLVGKAVAAIRGGSRAGRFLALAMAPLLPSALLYALTALGIVPETLPGRHLVHVAFTVTGFVVAFALADRVRAADEDARARLGRAVEERTRELATTVEALRREAEDRQRAEAARRESEEKLRHAQRIEAVGRLAGGIAHDYNNLLTSVATNVSILRMQPPPAAAEQREILQDVADATDRGAALTRQLLAFSRRQILSPQPLAANRVVEGVRRLLDRLIGENYRLQLELAPALPQVVADPSQLEQVIMNLVLNARDAMAKGGVVRVSTAEVLVGDGVAATQGCAAGRFVRISVADSGTGIAPEVLTHVFEPFFTTKAEGKGTGLGLATVHGIASQHGGFVEVDPGLGRGATFHVHLPVATEAALAAEPRGAATRGLDGGSETILLVEDDAVMREATSRLLSRLGYRVRTAHDATDAVRACEVGTPPELVITDLVMPGMDGLGLAEQLRRRWPGIRVLITSGHAHDVLAAHRVDGVTLPFLAKPYSPADLAARIRELLAGTGGAARPRTA